MHRVLKPGGRARIVDMNRKATNAQINALTRDMGVKGGEALFMKLTFKHFLRRGAYSRQELLTLIRQSRFADHAIAEEGVGLSIMLSKSSGAVYSSSRRASSGSMIGMPSRIG
jgi:hypothetical protein